MAAGGSALRFRAVFAWNVPLPAAVTFTFLSRCRPLPRLDPAATTMAALTPHGRFGFPTPYSAPAETSAKPHSVTSFSLFSPSPRLTTYVRFLHGFAVPPCFESSLWEDRVTEFSVPSPHGHATSA